MEQAKKDCILKEAAKAFMRLGFKKASVDEIARGAGVAKGTIYLACDSKEDLFYQVLNREVRSWVAEVARFIDPRIPADQILAAMAQGGVDYLSQRPLVRDLLFGKTTEILPNWRDRLDELRAIGNANVVEVLRLGIRQKVFRADLDVEATATLLQDLQIATYLFHNRDGKEREARLLRRSIAGMDMILRGIRVEPMVVAGDIAR